MNSKPSKITIHMVCSLDGYIAKKDGDVSWMGIINDYQKGTELTDEIINTFLNKIDCYVMGSKTYEHALELGWPYGDKSVKVITKRALKSENDTVSFYSGELDALVKNLKMKYNDIWMVGGAKLTKEFITGNLADEIVITFVPIILGDGIPFFDTIGQEIPLYITDHAAYKNGMVELTYTFKK